MFLYYPFNVQGISSDDPFSMTYVSSLCLLSVFNLLVWLKVYQFYWSSVEPTFGFVDFSVLFSSCNSLFLLFCLFWIIDLLVSPLIHSVFHLLWSLVRAEGTIHDLWGMPNSVLGWWRCCNCPSVSSLLFLFSSLFSV